MPYSSPHASSSPHAGAAFLADLVAGGLIQQRVAVVVAHPDDEAIGAGGQLHRFKYLTLVVASNGAPRDGRDMRRTGHASIEDYARTRRAELMHALQELDIRDDALSLLDLPDGELIFAVERIATQLAEIFARNDIEIVMTHAYEGGHPDHDALALATQLAARRIPHPPGVVEMPYYHAGPHGWVLQRFPDHDPAPVTIELDANAWGRKCAMLDAHRSQAEVLSGFRQRTETFRLAPAHDFTQPPSTGRWLYEQVAPALRPAAWLARAREALVAEGGA
ncbi:MAG: LmbE family protein [Hyphomicrobiales bacterium]|jgi:LmbE family N-acetylglucosaminyl deacetylase|nr:LmbE family protein [Hyphomicrobiales bacterium]